MYHILSANRYFWKYLFLQVADKSTSKYIDDFNPEFYAAANPDVVKAIGKDPDALYKHYMNFGKAEGRKPHA